MTTRRVTTQAELDAALADPKVTQIDIHSPDGVWLNLDGHRGSSHVDAWGSSHVVAWDSSHVVARDSSHVVAWDSSHVDARDSSHVVAWDSSHVDARGSSHVVAWDSSHVVAWDSSHVVAWDSSHVVARDSSHVDAGSYTSVHLHSGRAQVTGGVLIDLTQLDLTDPQAWCDYHGVTVEDGKAVLYKAVRDDYRSGHGALYTVGGTTSCDDFEANGQCGNGLHVSPTPSHAQSYDSGATRFIECRVDLATLQTLGDKVKAPAVECVREVDLFRRPVGEAAVAS